MPIGRLGSLCGIKILILEIAQTHFVSTYISIYNFLKKVNKNCIFHRKILSLFTQMKIIRRKILAFALLGVFMFALLGAIVPHSHDEGSVSHSHYGDGANVLFAVKNVHHTSHTTQEKLQKADLGHSVFLYDCNDCHAEDYHLHELPLTTQTQIKKVNHHSVIALLVSSKTLEWEYVEGVPKSKPKYKDKPHKNPYFLSIPLRGPPSLV